MDAVSQWDAQHSLVVFKETGWLAHTQLSQLEVHLLNSGTDLLKVFIQGYFILHFGKDAFQMVYVCWDDGLWWLEVIGDVLLTLVSLQCLQSKSQTSYGPPNCFWPYKIGSSWGPPSNQSDLDKHPSDCWWTKLKLSLSVKFASQAWLFRQKDRPNELVFIGMAELDGPYRNIHHLQDQSVIS